MRRAKRLRIGRRLVLAGALLLVAAAGVAIAKELSEDVSEPAEAFRVAPDSVAVLDPASTRVTGQVRIPGRPGLLAADGRSVWVMSDASRRSHGSILARSR